MSDPYKVLGVSSSATDDEIKKAYRALVKQYHPDNYTNNPLADLAAEKMKEINLAYDEIQKIRAGGGSSSSGSSYSGGNSGSAEMGRVRQLINAGRGNEAEILLNRIPVGERTAEWHFLKGVILYRNGWVQDARSEIETACRMDPYNNEYRSFQQRMSSGAEQSPYGGYGAPQATCDVCDLCQAMMCLNCLCNGCR
jgi:hypothetical protein